MTAVDLADIQGDILRAYGKRYRHTAYVFLAVDRAEAGRAWLRDHVDRVTTAVWWPAGQRPRVALNIAFTHAGLAALGVAPRVLRSFPSTFTRGMAARWEMLGDTNASHPSGWDERLRPGAAHVLVTLNAMDGAACDAALAELEAGLDGMRVLHTEPTAILGDAREHFGFGDGFSQPAIEGVSDAEFARGRGVPEPGGAWRPLALGEFILGYEDEESRVDPQRRLPRAPAAPLGRSSTFMVWRKLHQDVALFRRTIRDAARHYTGGDERMLMAKVVGRWPNGAPLETSPHAEPPSFDPRADGANDFRYGGDADGRSCPLGAHIRRTNPRDALGFDGKLSFRHRIIRRGMPYGPPLEPGAMEDDGRDRGLIFVCFNASISRQFESVQRQWINDGNGFHLGRDTDFLMGGGGGPLEKMTIQGDPPFLLAPQGTFVTCRGGEYLFAPGITGLAAIADGVT
jgi:Dyp-type peroxidase family